MAASTQSRTRVILCAAAPERPNLKKYGPRRTKAETGPCFGVTETTGMLQMITRLGSRLAFAVRSRRCSSTMFRTPFRSGMSSGDSVLTLVAPGSSLLVRRSHGYLRPSAALG
jgi:hypothetical protein